MTESIRFSLSALAAKYLFYGKPVVWVEGPTDVVFFKSFDGPGEYKIAYAEGKDRLRALAEETLENNLPYVLVFDGGYDVLEAPDILQARVIRLDRHSMENYLFEEEVIERVCWKYVAAEPGESLSTIAFRELIERFDESFYEVIILDIARCRSDSDCPGFLPERIESLLTSRPRLTFAVERLEELERVGRQNLADDDVRETRDLVDQFLRSRRLADICPGHLVFGLARELLLNAVRRGRGRKLVVDNDTVLVLLSEAAWELLPSTDHTTLRAQLAHAINEAADLLV